MAVPVFQRSDCHQVCCKLIPRLLCAGMNWLDYKKQLKKAEQWNVETY